MHNMYENSLIVTVLKRGKASKVLHALKNEGVSGGTILYGEGTADSSILKLLDLDHTRKEVLLSVIKRDIEDEVIQKMIKKFRFDSPNTGIIFTVPLIEIITNKQRYDRLEVKEKDNMSHEVIFVVVENHRGDEVVEIANAYGAKGATIMHGRGSGLHEKGSIFNITIEPEKEVVMVLVPKEQHAEIIDGLSKDLKIDEPGNGIIFSAGVSQAYGLVE